jgi:Tol biopolymer transport system component
MSRLWMVSLVLVWLIAACDTTPKQLPTPIDINEFMTHQAETATSLAPTETATRVITLPPSFTPGFPTPLPTDTIDPALLPTETPIGYNPFGTIYYLYNDDTIAAVRGDGEVSRIIFSFGVGQRISDVTLSPDNKLLAYSAPGGGSAREVFVTNTDGTFTQKVSCLGFAYIDWIVWAPDSQHIAFFAAPLETTQGDIYIASYVGANTCPDGNQQRMVVPLQTLDMRGMTFSSDGGLLYYAGGGTDLYAWDLATNARYRATQGIGAGDYSPVRSPVDDRIAVLAQTYNEAADKLAGGLAILENTLVPPTDPKTLRGIYLDGQYVRWNADGTVLVVGTADRLWFYDPGARELDSLTDLPLPIAPDGAASPNGREIAYTNLDANGILQIFVYARRDGSTRQVTRSTEGTLANLIWSIE